MGRTGISPPLYNGVRIVNAPCPENIKRLDLGAIPMVLNMQRNGLLLDCDHLRRLSVRLKEEEDAITEKVYDLTGQRLNMGSVDQLAHLLFNVIGLRPPKGELTGSGKRFKLDDEVLDSLKADHPVVVEAKRFRECNKLRTSYADTLPGMVDSEGRIHTNLRVTRQVTGRISSSDPNLMAQPTRSDLGREIRNAYVAPPGKKLGTIDMSQVEMRTAAHEAECLSMIDTFLRRGDIHAETASRMFGLPVEKLDKMRHRYPAKRVGFGVLFGITALGLYAQIIAASDPKWTEEQRLAFIAEWSEDKCEATIQSWFDSYPEIRALMGEYHARARRFGYVWDMWGRIRHIPEVYAVARWVVEAGLRQAGNMPIQSGAQGLMKLAMAKIQDIIDDEYGDAVRPLLQIHDELLFEGEPDAMAEAMPRFSDVMYSIAPLDVPIESSYAIGDRWGELEK